MFIRTLGAQQSDRCWLRGRGLDTYTQGNMTRKRLMPQWVGRECGSGKNTGKEQAGELRDQGLSWE